jgi:hypothetical protein
MKKILTFCLLAATFAVPSGAQTATSYTLELADGVSSSCGILTNSNASRVLLTASTDVKVGKTTQVKCNYNSGPAYIGGQQLPGVQMVYLSSFTKNGDTYSYSWTNLAYNMVAIQVDLTNYSKPDIWNGSCTYTPSYGGSHTTFYQQYTNPDSSYSCGCNEGWVTP